MAAKFLVYLSFVFQPMVTVYGEQSPPIPWALTFGPSAIILSHSDQAGNIEVWKTGVDSSYREFFNETISCHGERWQWLGIKWRRMPDGQKIHDPFLDSDYTRITHMFENTIGTGTQHFVENGHFQENSTYAALFLPKSLNDTTLGAASMAAFPRGQFSTRDGYKKTGNTASAAAYAYGLDQCERYLSPRECADWYPETYNLTLVVEYQKSYVHLHLLSVDVKYGVFPTHRERLNKTLGENSELLSGDGNHSKRDDAYLQELHNFISTFIQERYDEEHQDIMAIVGMGEASAEAISALLDFTYTALGNKEATIYNTIDPSVVAAFGAALYARDHFGEDLVDDEPENDEL